LKSKKRRLDEEQVSPCTGSFPDSCITFVLAVRYSPVQTNHLSLKRKAAADSKSEDMHQNSLNTKRKKASNNISQNPEVLTSTSYQDCSQIFLDAVDVSKGSGAADEKRARSATASARYREKKKFKAKVVSPKLKKPLREQDELQGPEQDQATLKARRAEGPLTRLANSADPALDLKFSVEGSDLSTSIASSCSAPCGRSMEADKVRLKAVVLQDLTESGLTKRKENLITSTQIQNISLSTISLQPVAQKCTTGPSFASEELNECELIPALSSKEILGKSVVEGSKSGEHDEQLERNSIQHVRGSENLTSESTALEETQQVKSDSTATPDSNSLAKQVCSYCKLRKRRCSKELPSCAECKK
jgi:hypothetical protein